MRVQQLVNANLTHAVQFPRLIAQLDHAIQWLSRSRDSTTLEEQFLCAWIAVEFLIQPDEAAGPIKGNVTSKISTLISRGDRTIRRYWTRKMDDCYDLRCDLVHEAKTDKTKLETLLPFLTQAIVECLYHCVGSLEELTDDCAPADLLN